MAPRRRLLLVLAAALMLAGCGAEPKQAKSPDPTKDLGSLATSGAGHVFYEIYPPAGPPRGTLIVFHGGGWADAPGDARRGMFGTAVSYAAEGWRVVDAAYTSAYRPGGKPDPLPMMRDVVAFYDQVRRAFPGKVCAAGPSAGGHLAAMLAVLRPRLTCAVVNAGPTDLGPLLGDNTDAAPYIGYAFGTDARTLDRWSPARLWKRHGRRPAMFLAFARRDPFVNTRQGVLFKRADPHAVLHILGAAKAGAANSFPFVHSAVTASAWHDVADAQEKWFDREAPLPAHADSPRPLSSTRSCDAAVPSADWRTAARDDRWKLLRAGVGWMAGESANGGLVATQGCSGSADSQDDGLSVWAAPAKGQRAPKGALAWLTFSRGGRPLHSIAVTLRGFLRRPGDWNVGLYADAVPVAACERGRCHGLRLVSSGGGALVASPGSGNPDADDPPVQRIGLPVGTTTVSIRMTCARPGGCSLSGRARPRDPVGHAAVLSVYSAVVR